MSVPDVSGEHEQPASEHPQDQADTGASLSESGRLLYVGITDSLAARFWNGHRRRSPWWPEFDRITIERYDRRAEAEAAEVSAIRTEDPAYNSSFRVHPTGRTDQPLAVSKQPLAGSKQPLAGSKQPLATVAGTSAGVPLGDNFLYRFFGEHEDKHNALLYTGITDRLGERFWNGHKHNARWWPHTKSVVIERYPSREQAKAAETRVISKEHPVHNIYEAADRRRQAPVGQPVREGRPGGRAGGSRQAGGRNPPAGPTGLGR